MRVCRADQDVVAGDARDLCSDTVSKHGGEAEGIDANKCKPCCPLLKIENTDADFSPLSLHGGGWS